MANDQEHASRRNAEQAREATWRGSSFLREVFLGRLRLDLLPAGPRYPHLGVLAPHMRFAARSRRRLARSIFHGMVRTQLRRAAGSKL